jgi:hypothetical protein
LLYHLLKGTTMIMMLARHKVADAAKFVEGYNSPEIKAVRDISGVANDAVFSTVEDANDVLVWHEFSSLEEAQAFVDNPGLAEAMGQLGVVEPPHIQMFTKH